MSNETFVSGGPNGSEAFVDNGDGWRSFDNRVTGALLPAGRGSMAATPAAANNPGKSKNIHKAASTKTAGVEANLKD